jgi:acetyl esterase/lipase
MARPQTPAQLLTYPPEQNIPSNAPPMFIAVGRDDKIVYPSRNGIAMYDALRAAKIPAELHVFDVGPHGISDKPGTAGGDWPPLFMRWGQRYDLFKSS